MVCDPQNRIGQNVEEIMAHPFFRGTDWDHIRDRPSAIQVNVKHMADTSNFDDFEELDEQKKSECVVEGWVWVGCVGVWECGWGVGVCVCVERYNMYLSTT